MGKVKIGNVIGPTGPEGKQGKSGTMKVGTVRTLQPGEAAIVSNSGTTENSILDFAIPRGDDGITDLVAEYKDASEHTCTPTVVAPVVIKEIAGKTEQVVTTGAQLLDMSGAKGGTFAGITVTVHSDGTYDFVGAATDRSINVWLAGNYNVSTPVLFYLDPGTYYIRDIALFTGDKSVGGEMSNGYSFTLAERTPVTGIRAKYATVGQTYNERCYPMLSAGSTALPWEPYTGGKPGPNPEYPMPIEGVGDSGSLVVETNGAQLLDVRNGKSRLGAEGVAYTNNGDGTYSRKGVSTGIYGNAWFLGSYEVYPNADNIIITLKRGKTYYIKDCILFTMTENGAKSRSGIFMVDDAFPDGFKVTGVRNCNQPIGTTYDDTIYPMVIEATTEVPYQPYHHTTATIPLSSPLYDGDKICCVQPGESYVDADGNRAVAHRVMWGVRRENGVAVFDGSEDEGWLHENGWKNNAYYSSSKLSNLERVEGYTTIADVYSNFGLANSASKVSDSGVITNGVAIGGIKNLYVFAGDICQKGDVLAWREYLSTHNLHVVYKLATPYFEPFPNQSPFHALRSADNLTYIYTDDALKPEITVDVAKQAAGGYLLSGYMDREDGIMVDKTTGAECVLCMEDGLLTVYEIEED